MCLEGWCNLWPVSPAPESAAVFLGPLPGPRPHAASHSSARPVAHSRYSSWGYPSSDQLCVPSDAEDRCYSQSTVPELIKWINCHLHFKYVCIFLVSKLSCGLECWRSPASAPPGLWPAVSALSGQSELLLPLASPQSAPLVVVPHWSHLVATCSSKEGV